MSEPASEHMAALNDSFAIAEDARLYGPPRDLTWAFQWRGIWISADYWSGPYNENRVCLRMPIAGNGSPTPLSAGIHGGYASAEVSWVGSELFGNYILDASATVAYNEIVG